MLGIIMAGGQGTRLMPLTQTRPKPMVEVLGRPVIDYVKDAMVRAGITEIVVTTGYRGEQLRDHVHDWNGTFPDERQLKARVNQEVTPMGTAISTDDSVVMALSHWPNTARYRKHAPTNSDNRQPLA